MDFFCNFVSVDVFDDLGTVSFADFDVVALLSILSAGTGLIR